MLKNKQGVIVRTTYNMNRPITKNLYKFTFKHQDVKHFFSNVVYFLYILNYDK